jgi:hypothetical protein
MSRGYWLVAAVVLLGAPARGEDAAGVAVGNRVRLQTASGRLIGTVDSIRDDVLVITEASAGPRTVARGEVRRLQISDGRSRGKGAGIGLAVGAVIGIGLGLLYENGVEETESNPMFSALPLIGGGVCGAVGAGLGAAAGRETWRDGTVSAWQNGRSSAGGVRFQVALRF